METSHISSGACFEHFVMWLGPLGAGQVTGWDAMDTNSNGSGQAFIQICFVRGALAQCSLTATSMYRGQAVLARVLMGIQCTTWARAQRD